MSYNNKLSKNHSCERFPHNRAIHEKTKGAPNSKQMDVAEGSLPKALCLREEPEGRRQGGRGTRVTIIPTGHSAYTFLMHETGEGLVAPAAGKGPEEGRPEDAKISTTSWSWSRPRTSSCVATLVAHLSRVVFRNLELFCAAWVPCGGVPSGQFGAGGRVDGTGYF
uniref:Uncharacterized protein n=1 Tax=Steinernema glaseri TaxID=37863 RepID=A0A1I8AKN3_9BILA